MKYSLIKVTASPPKVVMTYPFRWMAQLMERVYGGEKAGYGVAETPTDPQEVIDICVHRDGLQAALHEAHDMQGKMIGILFGLLARDDEGKWVTVHGADHLLDDETNAACDSIFGHPW